MYKIVDTKNHILKAIIMLQAGRFGKLTEQKEQEMKERLIQIFFEKGAIQVIDDNEVRVLRSREEVQDYVQRHPDRWCGTTKKKDSKLAILIKIPIVLILGLIYLTLQLITRRARN